MEKEFEHSNSFGQLGKLPASFGLTCVDRFLLNLTDIQFYSSSRVDCDQLFRFRSSSTNICVSCNDVDCMRQLCHVRRRGILLQFDEDDEDDSTRSSGKDGSL